MENNDEQRTIFRRKSNINKFLFGWVKDNYDKAFVGVLVLAFILRFIIFLKTMDQAIWWDAADYLATAKRWAGINPHFIDMWYYRRGFFWPLFGAFFFWIGIGEIGIRISVLFFSAGIVASSYFLVSKMFGKKHALLTSIALSFSWVYLFFSGRPLTNLPATFFLITALLFFWKGYALKEGNKFIYLFGLFYALSCLTRMQYVMFALPLFIFVFTRENFKFLKNKHLWVAVGIFFLIFTPQFVMHYYHFGNPIADLAKYYLGVGSSQSGEVGVSWNPSVMFIYFKNLPYILDGNNNGYSTFFTLSPMYILFIVGFFYFFFDMFLGIDKIFREEEVQKKFFIFFWFIYTFILLSHLAPQLEQRYMMQTLPFLFLIAIQPLLLIEKFLVRDFKIKKGVSFIIIVLLIVLFLYPSLSFGNNLTDVKKTSYLEVKQAGEWIKDNSNPGDIIISSSLPQTTYYSERATYPFNLAYRRDLPRMNTSQTEEFILTEKPRYMQMSIFENIPDFNYWAVEYPQKNPNFVVPVKGYFQGENPVLIIYEFNYSAIDNS